MVSAETALISIKMIFYDNAIDFDMMGPYRNPFFLCAENIV